MGATELLEALDEHGFDADYEDLLDNTTIGSVVASLRKKTEYVSKVSTETLANTPVGLMGPQVIWAHLDKQGWGSWANISLCISMPASVIPAGLLPAIVQAPPRAPLGI